MFEVLKIANGKTVVVTAYREYDQALAKAAEMSRIDAAVYAVRRKDIGRILAYCVRGERTTSAQRVVELVTDPQLPAALGLSVAPVKLVIAPDPEPEPDEDDGDPLNMLSYTELRDMARDLGIAGRSSMNREALIAAIRSAENQPGPSELKGLIDD